MGYVRGKVCTRMVGKGRSKGALGHRHNRSENYESIDTRIGFHVVQCFYLVSVYHKSYPAFSMRNHSWRVVCLAFTRT